MCIRARVVLEGDDCVIRAAKPGTIVIDMSSIAPLVSKEVGAALAKAGIVFFDAPVSGGEPKAIDGTLSIMVGGEKETYTQCLPIFQAMGTNIIYEGKAGAGQHTKMANQIAIAGALAGVCEALTYAKRAGLDPARVYETIRTGAARSGQLDIIAPKVLNGDFSAAFYLRHFVKDMGIASQECRDRGLELEVLEQVLADCRQIEAEGHGGEGTQALIRHYPWAD